MLINDVGYNKDTGNDGPRPDSTDTLNKNTCSLSTYLVMFFYGSRSVTLIP